MCFYCVIFFRLVEKNCPYLRMQSDDKLCLICMEDDAKASSCACKSAYFHDECLLNMLKTTKKTYCTVCLNPFRNVVINEVVRTEWHSNYRNATIILFSSVLLIVLSLWVVSITYKYYISTVFSWSLVLLILGFVALAFSLHHMWRSHQDNVPCCIVKDRSTNFTIVELT